MPPTEAQNRGALRTVVFEHRPSRLWALLGVSRCVVCGEFWQCDVFVDAVNALAAPPNPPGPGWPPRWPGNEQPGRW